MSKQRALELCDEAMKWNGGHAEFGGITRLADAIRELAREEPEDPRYKEAFDNCCTVRDYLAARVAELDKQVDDLTVELAKAKSELDNQKYRAFEH